MPQVVNLDGSIQFESSIKSWRDRFREHGDAAVGRLGEDHKQQAQKIEHELVRELKGSPYFRHGLDFGCGYGRFTNLLSSYCGHLWVADIVEEQLQRAASTNPTISPILIKYPIALPLEDQSIDFMADIMSLQSVSNEILFEMICLELSRVLRAGASVVILHVAGESKAHVKSREPAKLCEFLGVDLHNARDVNVDQAKGKYWLIRGVKPA